MYLYLRHQSTMLEYDNNRRVTQELEGCDCTGGSVLHKHCLLSKLALKNRTKALLHFINPNFIKLLEPIDALLDT